MSFTELLINTCTVRRFVEGAADDYGTPAKIWSDHIIDEPCRLVAGSGREVNIGAEVVIADYKLFIGDVDITEQDRIIVAGVLHEVLLVLNRQDELADHHKECLLRVVR